MENIRENQLTKQKIRCKKTQNWSSKCRMQNVIKKKKKERKDVCHEQDDGHSSIFQILHILYRFIEFTISRHIFCFLSPAHSKMLSELECVVKHLGC